MLFDQINTDYIQARKDRDSLRSGALNFLKAQLKNLCIEKKIDKLEDVDVVAVIKKQVKQRQDSIEQYEKGGRPELADKEKKELAILKSYLPEEMSAEQISGLVDETVKELNAQSMKDMGAVMKALGPKTAGRADNKLVSDLVKKALTS